MGAGGGAGIGVALAQQARGGRGEAAQEVIPLVPLGNGEPPALQFQAYPGGTGALLERLWGETGGDPFARHAIEIAPWEGPVPTNEEEIAFLPVHRLAALIRERRISPIELTEIYLERLKRYDPVLLCAVTILDGRGREEAEQAEADLRAGNWRGPLHGIPWGVKDLFAVRGAPTTWGAEDFREQVIDEDAEVVVRLREAGAVLIAKLATGRFAAGDNWFRGRTLNPWNLEQGSSGSSAGPASATAAGCVGFGIGTETQGSIVSPARRCGLSALRPTFGRISRYGGMVLSWSMDKVGPLCRTIEDCALVFNAIHGSDEKDPATVTAPFRFETAPDLSRLRIGYTEDAPEAFVDKLRELGARPVPAPELPDGRSNSLGVESAAAFDFWVTRQAEAAAEEPTADATAAEAGRGERGARGQGGRGVGAAGGRGAGVQSGRGAGGQGGRGEGGEGGRGGGGRRGRFTGGRDVLALDYVQSQRRRHLLMVETAAALEGFDMFVSGSGEVRLTNQTGHPAAIVPYAMSDDDHPQPQCTTIIGALFADDKILSVAHAYQAATEWHLRHPQLD
jgi:Asp-tRNA(Asn)/Glu-tRNA(Gln) amidotransferase A subunit family amidase